MQQRGQLAGTMRMREGDQSPASQGLRNLKWAEIAGLIRFSQDGSWEPTAVAKAWLAKQECGEVARPCAP